MSPSHQARCAFLLRSEEARGSVDSTWAVAAAGEDYVLRSDPSVLGPSRAEDREVHIDGDTSSSTGDHSVRYVHQAHEDPKLPVAERLAQF